MQLQWNTQQAIASARRPFAWSRDATAETLLDEPLVINERPYLSRDTVSSIGLFARSRIIG